jgi:hypothetical protein
VQLRIMLSHQDITDLVKGDVVQIHGQEYGPREIALDSPDLYRLKMLVDALLNKAKKMGETE